jgi:hypothetical protein
MELLQWKYKEPMLAAICGPPAEIQQKSTAKNTIKMLESENINIPMDNDEDDGEDLMAPTIKRAKTTTSNISTMYRRTLNVIHPSHASSGYPGDPACKSWVVASFDPIFGWPSVVRHSWSTAKDYLDANGVQVDWPEETNNTTGGPQQMQLSRFMNLDSTTNSSRSIGSSQKSIVKSSIPLMSRPQFYRKRFLRSVTDL